MRVSVYKLNKMDLEQLQDYCLQFPFTDMDVKWDHLLCFTLKGKMFCTVSLDEDNQVSFKVTKEAYEELLQREGIRPAPYLWKNTWVRIARSNVLKQEEWNYYIRNAYLLVKAKLLKRDQFDFD